MKTYDYYLFDGDGTIFDTVDLICRCFQYITGKYTDTVLEREKIIAGIGSPLLDQLVLHLGPVHDHNLVMEDYLRYQLHIMEEGVAMFPGAAETLKTLKDAGKKLALVTSRRRFSLDVILQSTDTAQYFDVLVTPEDTLRHKPHPEPALKAISLMNAEKERAVFIGDAHYDICSGASAGIDTIFVNWSHAAPASLPIPPTWTIDSMRELSLGLGDTPL